LGGKKQRPVIRGTSDLLRSYTLKSCATLLGRTSGDGTVQGAFGGKQKKSKS